MKGINAIDFFATVGKDQGVLKCTTFPYQVEEDVPPLSAQELWDEAITDLFLLAPTDVLPDEDSWVFVQETVGGHPLEAPTIAYRKRRFSGRKDHISEILFLAPGEQIPNGVELLRSTVSGVGSGYLKPWGYFAIRRAESTFDPLRAGDSIILDIAVVKRDGNSREEIPEGFRPIERDSLNSSASAINPYSSSDNLFVIRTALSPGLCNVSYEPRLLDRYPEKDHSQVILPEEALPVFAFPKGLRLKATVRGEYPLPSFFTFVFTDQDGQHLYVACLQFYESLSRKDLLPAFEELWGKEQEFIIPEGKAVYCPKLVCVLSRVPFYRGMRRYLRQIYSLSLSASICPLEYFITSVVAQIPIPFEGGRPFHLVLDAALISTKSKPMGSIVFDSPPLRFFPVMDLDFAGPLRCLSVDTLLAVYILMLREAKLVFLSLSNAMLTEAMETLRMLLFPLSWSSCFVSRLPMTLKGLLQAPGGFMIGIHLDDWELAAGQSTKRFVSSMHLHYPMLQGTYVVDLATNTISMFNGRYSEVLNASQLDSITKTMPPGPKLRLRSKLFKIAEEFRIGPQLDSLEEMDSAFDFQQPSGIHDLDGAEAPFVRDWSKFPTLTVRDAFMSFIADVLGDYTAFILPPIDDLSADTYRTLREEFAIDEYLTTADSGCKQLLEYLMETQMFSLLLQQRSEGTLQPLVFFEEAAILQQVLGLSLSSHGGGKAPSVSELPAPLYKLLESDYQWSCLGKVMQQQLLQQRSVDHSKGQSAKLITILSTSSLSSLRGGSHTSHGISQSQHHIHNQKLLDLLTFIDFALSEAGAEGVEDMSHTMNLVARQDLDRQESLQLRDNQIGPLILPGPTIGDNVEAPAYDENRHLFAYRNGWPQLDNELIQRREHYLHPRMVEIKQERLYSLKNVSLTIQSMIRSPAERLFSDFTTSSHLQQSGNHSSSKEKEKDWHDNSVSIMSAIMTALSTSITMLSLRISGGKVHKQMDDMLQILGLIGMTELWNITEHVTETTWRCILIACAACGGDVMRRISALLYRTMTACGVVPNALTYGQYIKAITTSKQSATMQTPENYLDQDFYLEEIGFALFMQQIKGQKVSMSESTAADNKSNLFKRPLSRNSSYSTLRRQSSWTAALETDDIRNIEQLLHLKRSIGTVTLLKPKKMSAMIVPQPWDEPPADMMQYFQRRSDCLYAEARNVQLRTMSSSYKNRSRTSSTATSSSGHDSNSRNRNNSNSTAGGGLAGLTSTPKKLLNSFAAATSSRSARPSPSMGFMSRMATNMMSSSHHSSPAQQQQQAIVVAANGSNSQAKSPASASSFGSFFNKSSSMFSSGNKSAPRSPVPPPVSNNRNSMDGVTLLTPPPAPLPAIEERRQESIERVALAHEFDDEEDGEGEDSTEESESSSKKRSISVNSATVEDSGGSNVDEQGLSIGSTPHSPAPQVQAEELPNTSQDLKALDKPRAAAVDLLLDEDEAGKGDNNLDANIDDIIAELNNSTPIMDQGQVQEIILNTILDHNHENQHQAAIGMQCVCTCSSCGYSMMTEEVLALWCRGDSIDVHRPAHGRPSSGSWRKKSLTNADDGIQCPHCHAQIMPVLAANGYVASLATTVAEEGGSINDGQQLPVPITAWTEETKMLSPFGLQLEIEELLLKVGETVNDAHWLHTCHPCVYWNLHWYGAYLNFPTGLRYDNEYEAAAKEDHDQENGFHRTRHFEKDFYFHSTRKENDDSRHQLMAPIIIGWQRSVVERKIARMMGGLPGDYLDVKDLFPTATEHEIATIMDGVLGNLDGSPDGLRTAMLHLSTCSSLFANLTTSSLATNGKSSSVGLIKARKLYCSLLMLGTHFARLSLFDKKRAGYGLLRDYTKETSFDRYFIEAVKCVMSGVDFQQMHVTEAELILCANNTTANTVRAMLGVLP